MDELDLEGDDFPLDEFEQGMLDSQARIVEMLTQMQAILGELARIMAAPKVPVRDDKGRLLGVVPKI